MVHQGDLFDVLPTLAAESVDACVTDPPYGLGFMAKNWDVPGGIGAAAQAHALIARRIRNLEEDYEVIRRLHVWCLERFGSAPDLPELNVPQGVGE